MILSAGGINLKFDLNQTGLRRIFLGWQVEAMEYLWEIQVPVKSSDMHRYLERKDIRTDRDTRNTVSRGSVINFMNSLVNDGILTYTEETGKGGYHKIYSLIDEVKTRDAFKIYITDRIVNNLQTFRIEE